MCPEALHKGVELEGLFNSQHREYSVVLRAVANQFSGFLELLLNIKALNGNFSRCRRDIPCQTLKSGGLSSAVNSQKSKALTVIEGKRRFFYCFDRSAKGTCVLFLEVVNPDALNTVRVFLVGGLRRVDQQGFPIKHR